MVIILVGRKLLNTVITSIFIILSGFCFYQYMAEMKEENHQHEIPVQNISELNGQTASAFLTSAKAQLNIEIYDIGEGKVTKVVPVNDVALAEAKKILNGITGVFLKVNALPERGFIIKIPFESEISINNKWLNDYNINSIDEMFILFPDEGTPYLLVLDNNERPYLFNFKGNTDKLLKSLDFVRG